MTRTGAVVLAAVLVVLTGCLEQPRNNPLKRTPSAYSHLGGEQKVRQLVDQYADTVAGSAEVRQSVRQAFTPPDGPARTELVRQLSIALGGPYREKADRWKLALSGGAADATDADRAALLAMLDQALQQSQFEGRAEARQALGLAAKSEVAQVKPKPADMPEKKPEVKQPEEKKPEEKKPDDKPEEKKPEEKKKPEEEKKKPDDEPEGKKKEKEKEKPDDEEKPLPKLTAKATKTREALKARISVDFDDSRLEDALKDIRKKVTGLRVRLGPKGSAALGTKVTFAAQDRPADQVLDQVLGRAGLKHEIISDEDDPYDGALLIGRGPGAKDKGKGKKSEDD